MGAQKRAYRKTGPTDGSMAVSSAIVETREDDQCWSKHVVCIHVEKILTFKTFKGFKSKLHARRLINNRNKYVMCNRVLRYHIKKEKLAGG
jgi:hypothetical protein